MDVLMLESFRRIDVDTGGARIAAFVGGDGPPLLLLHGFPQTHVAWRLAERYTVVAPDLRQQGPAIR
jgi:haloacetate dehalogenase